MGHVADADGVLILDMGQEGSLVVDLEVEDAVLVGEGEVGGEDGLTGGLGLGDEVSALEGRKHGELELESVALGNLEGNPAAPGVLRDGNLVELHAC